MQIWFYLSTAWQAIARIKWGGLWLPKILYLLESRDNPSTINVCCQIPCLNYLRSNSYMQVFHPVSPGRNLQLWNLLGLRRVLVLFPSLKVCLPLYCDCVTVAIFPRTLCPSQFLASCQACSPCPAQPKQCNLSIYSTLEAAILAQYKTLMHAMVALLSSSCTWEHVWWAASVSSGWTFLISCEILQPLSQPNGIMTRAT